MQFEEWWQKEGEAIFKNAPHSDYAGAKAACKAAWDAGAPSSVAEAQAFNDVCKVLHTWRAEAPGETPLACLKRLLRELNERRNFSTSGAAASELSAAELLRLLALKEGAAGVLGEAGLLFEKKGKDYNTGIARDDYFPLGLASYVQMVWVKALRLLSFAKLPRPPANEDVRETLLDSINYAAFCADWLKRKGGV